MKLAVELYGEIIGNLEGDARTFDFKPTPEGIERFGSNSSILSVSIPLSHTPRRDHARRRRNWFAELLPEGDQLDFMLAQGALHRDDVPSFLARYGRDVAGALQIWNVDDPTEPRVPALARLSESDVCELLKDPLRSPLGNQEHAGKSSLGGVQPKIVLTKTNHGWAQALGGYATTHILKPQLQGHLSSVIFDEEYGARLCRRIGLADFSTEIQSFDGLPTLVVERYDRNSGRRVHQEDFNQILGAHGNEKYQELGGIVSLKRVAETIKRYTLDASLRRLAQMVILSIAVGNLDMHTKNLALLHSQEGNVTLAPAYDVVPQVHMNNDGKLALSINGVYRHRDITRDDLIAELDVWGVRQTSLLVDRTLRGLVSIVTKEEPIVGAFPNLQNQILETISNLQTGHAAGLQR